MSYLLKSVDCHGWKRGIMKEIMIFLLVIKLGLDGRRQPAFVFYFFLSLFLVITLFDKASCVEGGKLTPRGLPPSLQRAAWMQPL